MLCEMFILKTLVTFCCNCRPKYEFYKASEHHLWRRDVMMFIYFICNMIFNIFWGFLFNCDGVFLQDDVLCHKFHIVTECFEEHAGKFKLKFWLINSQLLIVLRTSEMSRSVSSEPIIDSLVIEGKCATSASKFVQY